MFLIYKLHQTGAAKTCDYTPLAMVASCTILSISSVVTPGLMALAAVSSTSLATCIRLVFRLCSANYHACNLYIALHYSLDGRLEPMQKNKRGQHTGKNFTKTMGDRVDEIYSKHA